MKTERLELRRWRAEDLEPFAALNADPVVMEHFPRLLSRAESDALVERIDATIAELGFGLWAVQVTGGAPFIGFVGITPVPFDAPFTPAVEVGWRLAREHWGHGYATEAAAAAMRFGFDTLALTEIVSFTAPANVRSRAVMERLRMTRDPSDDFDHPLLDPSSPLRRHVLYRARRS